MSLWIPNVVVNKRYVAASKQSGLDEDEMSRPVEGRKRKPKELENVRRAILEAKRELQVLKQKKELLESSLDSVQRCSIPIFPINDGTSCWTDTVAFALFHNESARNVIETVIRVALNDEKFEQHRLKKEVEEMLSKYDSIYNKNEIDNVSSRCFKNALKDLYYHLTGKQSKVDEPVSGISGSWGISKRVFELICDIDKAHEQNMIINLMDLSLDEEQKTSFGDSKLTGPLGSYTLSYFKLSINIKNDGGLFDSLSLGKDLLVFIELGKFYEAVESLSSPDFNVNVFPFTLEISHVKGKCELSFVSAVIHYPGHNAAISKCEHNDSFVFFDGMSGSFSAILDKHVLMTLDGQVANHANFAPCFTDLKYETENHKSGVFDKSSVCVYKPVHHLGFR